MNSHDNGVAYALNSTEGRQRIQQRANQIAEITDAIHQGFKAEPDLAPHHLPLLSDAALAMIYRDSEAWRNKWKERELEERLSIMTEAEHQMSVYYVNLRGILGALDVPSHFRAIDGNPKHIAWTERQARELVKKAGESERNRKAAEDAEGRVDLLERYVKACDEKLLPYNWNVFKMGTNALQDLVLEHEGRERLTNIATSAEDAHWFETRKAQDTEQSLRWHAQRHEAVRQLINHMNNSGEISVEKASELMDTLLDRPQDGEQDEEWIVWQRFDKDRRPPLLKDDDMVEIETVGGGRNTLEAAVVAWEQVKRFRRAK